MDIYDLMGMLTLGVYNKSEHKEKTQYIQQAGSPTKFMYRPETFEQYISQDKAKDKAKLTIELINKGFPRHFLLMGNAGYGKTTLAGIIAKELGFNFNVYVGSNFDIDTLQDFLGKNQDSKLPNVLFIDEMAELNKQVLTYMLPIIEDYKINNMQLRKFILIGATTDTWVLSKRCQPFLDRIHCKIYLEDYAAQDIKKLLVQYNDQIHKANVSSEDYDIIARNVRYTPRLAIALFDYFVACGDLNRVLQMNRIIKDGLDDIDVRILESLNSTGGKPIGEEALSIVANMTRAEYKELREPYLMRQGLISRGSRGRLILTKGQEFLQRLKHE
jgi:Holliday junction DNA helicase RuvB